MKSENIPNCSASETTRPEAELKRTHQYYKPAQRGVEDMGDGNFELQHSLNAAEEDDA